MAVITQKKQEMENGILWNFKQSKLDLEKDYLKSLVIDK